jgi:hypothetical protein
MKKQEYRAGLGARFGHKDAQTIGDFIEVRFKGHFSPEDLVVAARPQNSPLHKFFEWNDEKAAGAYRVTQARGLANSVHVIVHSAEGSQELRAFHSMKIDDDGEREYMSIRVILSDGNRRQQVIDGALRELQGWQARHQAYGAVFGGVFEAIGKIKPKPRRSKRQIRASATP